MTFLSLRPSTRSSAQVLTSVVGGLGEAAGDPECCTILLRGGGVTTLIQLLRRTSDKLLLNVTRALGACAADEEALEALLQQDGLRLLWSHLKNPNCRVQASAANAICTCLQQESVSLPLRQRAKVDEKVGIT